MPRRLLEGVPLGPGGLRRLRWPWYHQRRPKSLALGSAIIPRTNRAVPTTSGPRGQPSDDRALYSDIRVWRSLIPRFLVCVVLLCDNRMGISLLWEEINSNVVFSVFPNLSKSTDPSQETHAGFPCDHPSCSTYLHQKAPDRFRTFLASI